MTTGDPYCPRCGSLTFPGAGICPCWQYPAPQGWTPPTFSAFAPPRLSDEDVERIARRVVDLLKETRT